MLANSFSHSSQRNPGSSTENGIDFKPLNFLLLLHHGVNILSLYFKVDLHENERIWTPGAHPRCPLRSTTGYIVMYVRFPIICFAECNSITLCHAQVLRQAVMFVGTLHDEKYK